MKELIEYIKHEWSTVSAAPFTFLVIFALALVLAYTASAWKHDAIIGILRERLGAKDQQLDEYRERLHLVPAQGNEFTRLSHKELQTEALKFVTSLREWRAARDTEDSQRQQQLWTAMTRATDEVQKKQLWDAQTADISQSGRLRNQEYETRFKIKAILLRDEMLTRVQRPQSQSQSQLRLDILYEHPTNPIGIGMVADDLETLARNLKQ